MKKREVNEEMICINCGKRIKDNSDICDKCGVYLDGTGIFDRKTLNAISARRRKRMLIIIISAFAVLISAAATVSYYAWYKPLREYNSAVKLMDEKKYDEAITEFEKMKDYKDSEEKIGQCNDGKKRIEYDAACTLIEKGEYEKAKKAFEALGDFSDSKAMALQCEEEKNKLVYAEAAEYMKNEEYEKAAALFSQLGSFSDAVQQANKCTGYVNSKLYKQACELYDSGSFKEAMDIFTQLGYYNSSNVKAEECQKILSAVKKEKAASSYIGKSYSDVMAAYGTPTNKENFCNGLSGGNIGATFFFGGVGFGYSMPDMQKAYSGIEDVPDSLKTFYTVAVNGAYISEDVKAGMTFTELSEKVKFTSSAPIECVQNEGGEYSAQANLKINGYDCAMLAFFHSEAVDTPSVFIIVFCTDISMEMHEKFPNSDKWGTVTLEEGNLNVRSGAGTSFGIVGKLKHGDKVKICREITSADGSSKWYYVYNKNVVGYVSADYVS